jgi:hypothetical protein
LRDYPRLVRAPLPTMHPSGASAARLIRVGDVCVAAGLRMHVGV